MKKVLSLLVLFASISAAQTTSTSSVAELKQLAAQIKNNSATINAIPQTAGRKNAGLAILYSILLPGMGELYAGDYSTGMYFTIADGLLWGTLAGFNIYGDWKMDNYKSLAKTYAGITTQGKDSKFYTDLGIYMSVDEYNQIQELDRNFENVYDKSTHYWSWMSNDKRKEYRNLWTSSEQSYNNVRFVAGALILNRIISAINAVRLVSAHNKSLNTETSWNVSFGVMNNPTLPSGMTINFTKAF